MLIRSIVQASLALALFFPLVLPQATTKRNRTIKLFPRLLHGHVQHFSTTRVSRPFLHSTRSIASLSLCYTQHRAPAYSLHVSFLGRPRFLTSTGFLAVSSSATATAMLSVLSTTFFFGRPRFLIPSVLPPALPLISSVPLSAPLAILFASVILFSSSSLVPAKVTLPPVPLPLGLPLFCGSAGSLVSTRVPLPLGLPLFCGPAELLVLTWVAFPLGLPLFRGASFAGSGVPLLVFASWPGCRAFFSTGPVCGFPSSGFASSSFFMLPFGRPRARLGGGSGSRSALEEGKSVFLRFLVGMLVGGSGASEVEGNAVGEALPADDSVSKTESSGGKVDSSTGWIEFSGGTDMALVREVAGSRGWDDGAGATDDARCRHTYKLALGIRVAVETPGEAGIGHTRTWLSLAMLPYSCEMISVAFRLVKTWNVLALIASTRNGSLVGQQYSANPLAPSV